jgi:hypothetical protein
MRKTSFLLVIIITVVGLNVFVYRVYGKCIDECMKKCDATIDENSFLKKGDLRYGPLRTARFLKKRPLFF